jgi:trk system potassium uptake protein TrkH
VGLDQLGGLIGVVTKLSIFTLIIEIVGALLFYVCWLFDENTMTNFWTALFHSISAFNNSGMDILGNFKSLTDYQGNSSVLFITAVLIIAGSTSYIVFADMVRNRRFIKLSLDTKIVLVTTLSLLVIGTLFYFIAEFSNPETLGQLSFPQKIIGALFLSVTPRTAGFANVNIGALHQVSLLFTMFLMFIGGAAGSTAGGIKVNTFGVLVITAINVIKGKDTIEAFGRQITKQTVFRALVVPIFYLLVLFFIVILLSITETFPVDNILFETFSALSTVGLSTGITPDLSIIGRLIITAAMFIGRLGPLALMAFLVRRHQPTDVEYPHETIRFG